MAVREPRYEKKENRLKLHEHIPFDTPVALHVDVCSACNLRCNFCANHSPNYNGITPRKYQVMDFELFKKIIDDTAEFPSDIISLRLYNVGEPLLNPKLPEMIAYAKKTGRFKKIDTTTNGIALTHELSERIAEAGLDFICFSIESLTAEGYVKICNTEIDYDKLVENIKYFYAHRKNCKVHIKTMNVAVPTKEEEEKFYDLFSPYCDSIWIDSVTNVWPDFEACKEEDYKFNMYGEQIKPLVCCTQPFYNLSVNPDGTVTHCDLDWKNEFIIGDLTKQSLVEVWNSDIVRKTQILHLQGRRKEISICSKCTWPDNGCIDDFDEYRLEVLKRYEIE